MINQKIFLLAGLIISTCTIYGTKKPDKPIATQLAVPSDGTLSPRKNDSSGSDKKIFIHMICTTKKTILQAIGNKKRRGDV